MFCSYAHDGSSMCPVRRKPKIFAKGQRIGVVAMRTSIFSFFFREMLPEKPRASLGMSYLPVALMASTSPAMTASEARNTPFVSV